MGAQGLSVVDDPSNSDTALDRNYLRHELMPLLEQRWPGYRQTIARAASHLATARDQLADRAIELSTESSSAGDPGLSLPALLALETADAALALRQWLQVQGRAMPDQAPLLELLRQLSESSDDAAPVMDAGDYRLQRYRDGLYLLPELPRPPAAPVALTPGESRLVPGVGRVSLVRAEEGFWLAADETLELRLRRGGERCRPVGRSRGTSLKKYLQESALPPWWRKRVPLLFLEDELLAIGGMGPCRSSRWDGEGAEAEAPWRLHWEPGPGVAVD